MVLSDFKEDKAIEKLARALKSGRMSHACLFETDDAAKGRALLKATAKALICRELPGEGCGLCSSCRRIEDESHPDVIFLRREKAQLLTADIEGLQKRLLSRPLEAERNVALIEEAELMNTEAQNKLLKTLEEPRPGTVILLLCENREKLLPTIRSRCTSFSLRGSAKRSDEGLADKALGLLEAAFGGEDFYAQKALLTEALKTGKDQKQSDKALLLLDAMEEELLELLKGKKKLGTSVRRRELEAAAERLEEAKKTLLLNRGTAFNIQYLMKDLLLGIGQ